MDFEKIDKLLEKYWDGKTSLEEEKELQAFFREASVPESLKDTANLFRYFQQQKQLNITDISFDKDLRRKVSLPKGRIASLLFNSMRIAAGIVVLFVAVWLVRMEVREGAVAEVDTYDDPRMAFEETKKALMMISKSFGTAEEQAKKINLFNEAQEDIKKEKQPTGL